MIWFPSPTVGGANFLSRETAGAWFVDETDATLKTWTDVRYQTDALLTVVVPPDLTAATYDILYGITAPPKGCMHNINYRVQSGWDLEMQRYPSERIPFSPSAPSSPSPTSAQLVEYPLCEG